MIVLTRLSGSPFVLNSDLIERVDSAPDTIVTLVDGTKYVVAERLTEVVDAVRRHRAEVIALSETVQVAAHAASSTTGVPAPADDRAETRPALSVVAPAAPPAEELS
jgi:flagellar protein FlbD